MIIFLTVLIILLFTALILHIVGVVKDDGETDRWEHTISLLLVTFVFMGLAYEVGIIKSTPTAIDVYEGKTEIKYDITIRGNDTIITESTVVFKANK